MKVPAFTPCTWSCGVHSGLWLAGCSKLHAGRDGSTVRGERPIGGRRRVLFEERHPSEQTQAMANIAVQRIKREFKEVLKSEEVWCHR